MGQRGPSKAVEPIGRSQGPLLQCSLTGGARKLFHSEVLEGSEDLGLREKGPQLPTSVATAREEPGFVRVQRQLRCRSKGHRGSPSSDCNARALRGLTPVPGGEVVDIPPCVCRPRPLYSKLPGPGENSQS